MGYGLCFGVMWRGCGLVVVVVVGVLIGFIKRISSSSSCSRNNINSK